MISSFLTPEGSLALAIAALEVVLGYRFALPRRGRDLGGVAAFTAAVVVTLAASRGLVPASPPWPAPLALRLAGAAVLLLGLALAGASFKARLLAGPGALPVTGPYARLRHPLRTGLSLTLLGGLLRQPSGAGVAAVAIAVAVQALLARADGRTARRPAPFTPPRDRPAPRPGRR